MQKKDKVKQTTKKTKVISESLLDSKGLIDKAKLIALIQKCAPTDEELKNHAKEIANAILEGLKKDLRKSRKSKTAV